MADALQNDVANVMATLASRQGDGKSTRKYSGPERAAILLLALGEQHGAKIWNLLDDDELRQLSVVMSTGGCHKPPVSRAGDGPLELLRRPVTMAR